jgi:uncharacterized protein YrzB (UPF0473 family)
MGDQNLNGAGHVEELDESDDLDVVEFEDEEGNLHVAAILAVLEVDDLEYAVLAPVAQLNDDDSEELEIFLFQYGEDEEGNEMFAYIEDEAMFKKVQEAASTLLETDGPDDEEFVN